MSGTTLDGSDSVVVFALRAEIQRLRDGLLWYAERNHYDLSDWEDCPGESANWLFPPLDFYSQNQPAWMVDDGGIARAVLEGAFVNPNHADADAITYCAITTQEQYANAMQRVSELMPLDPAHGTPAGEELMLLAELVETYEKTTWELP